MLAAGKVVVKLFVPLFRLNLSYDDNVTRLREDKKAGARQAKLAGNIIDDVDLTGVEAGFQFVQSNIEPEHRGMTFRSIDFVGLKYRLRISFCLAVEESHIAQQPDFLHLRICRIECAFRIANLVVEIAYRRLFLKHPEWRYPRPVFWVPVKGHPDLRWPIAKRLVGTLGLFASVK